MNRPELWTAAAAAAPLLSYFLGRYHRWGGVAAGAAAFAAASYMLSAEIAAGAPYAALALWTAAALAHSALLNGRAGAAPDRSALQKALARAAALQAELALIKTETTLNAAGEKRSLAVYSAVKLLSETVEPQAAGKQLGKYLADYFGTEEAALYMAPVPGGPLELFSQAARGSALPPYAELPLGGGAGLSLSGGSGVNRLFSHTSWGDELSRVLTHNARLAVSFAGRGEIGVEYDKGLLKSDSYGDHFRQNTGLFAQWALEPAKGLTFIPSLRYDRNVAYAHQASPRLAVVYAPDYVWKFSAQAGRAWQAPTFADLYNPWVPAADRSPGLKPEHSWQTQAAAAGNFACGVWARLAAYYADVRDRIALDPARSWAAYNLDSAFNRGVEAGLGYKNTAFSAGLGYAHNVSKGRGAAGGYKPLAFSPRHRFTLDAGLKTAWFDVNSKAYYSARQYTAADNGGLKLPAYFTADLYLSRKFDRFEAFAGAENVLDEHYAQTADTINGYYPLPGRVFRCGLSVRFI